MDERPVTRYAKAPDGVSLAYQVTGEGPLDVVFVHAFAIPIDLVPDEPSFARFSRRFRGFSRAVWCEPRGVGASGGDYLDGFADDVANADITTVLDAVGCEQVVLIGTGSGGPIAITYASEHPDRVAAIVLFNTFAHYVREVDYPVGMPREVLESATTPWVDWWGKGTTELLAPSKSGDEGFREWWARCQRLGVVGDQIAKSVQVGHKRDVRMVLPGLAVPTLVLHREGNRYIRVEAGRYLAANIPGAKYVELPGNDHLFFVGDTDALVDEIEEFLTGVRSGAEADVLMATVLFTDIVSSTAHQARLGQGEWSRLTEQHDAMVRAAFVHHRGREVKTTGDGFLATFDATGRAMRCAAEIVATAKGFGLDLRAGIHAGDIEVKGGDIAGLPVSLAKRVCDLAASGEVLVSEAVRGLMAGSAIQFTDRGEHELKGVPGRWRLYRVES